MLRQSFKYRLPLANVCEVAATPLSLSPFFKNEGEDTRETPYVSKPNTPIPCVTPPLPPGDGLGVRVNPEPTPLPPENTLFKGI